MADQPEEGGPDIPEGAALFPLIPDELGIHPLLLALLHAVVFLDGSDENIMNDAAAAEALDGIANYLQRLQGPDLKRTREDMECLLAFGKEAEWPSEVMQFFQDFLKDFGVGRTVVQ
jgi:hypothetical protein